VEGAVVEVPDLGVSAITDATGVATIELRPGTALVQVKARGFEMLDEDVDLDEAALATGIELMLEIPIGDVVVTGTRIETLVQDAPVKTQVVGRDKIERTQARNLADTLDQNTGVRVEMNCQNCGFTQIRLNGLEGQYTQVLIDGRPVVSSLAGVYLAEQIPAEMIERVEIVKGGGSALYGGNAVGGVVNVITRKPARNFGDIQLRYGSIDPGGSRSWDGRLSANGGVIGADRTMSLHVYAGIYGRDAWDANGDGFSDLGQIRQIDGGASGHIELVPGGELQLKAHFLREHRRGGDNLHLPEHDAAVAERTRATRVGGDLRWNHQVGKGRYEMGYSLAYTERDSYYGGGGNVDPWAARPADWRDFDDDSWAAFVEAMEAKQVAMRAYGTSRNIVHLADAAYHHRFTGLGVHMLSVGAQFQADDLQDEFVGYSRVVDEMYWNLGGFVQHDWAFADWGESVIGVRLDKHSALKNPVASPRVALMFRPLSWMRLRTSFATGFRPPQIFDEDLHITIMGGEAQFIRNSPGLKPEKSYSVSQEIGADAPVGGGWRLKGGISGYVTILTDLFDIVDRDDPATPGEREFERENGGRVLVYGGEASFGADWRERVGLDLGVTLERSRRDDPDPDFGSTSLFRTPSAYGFVGVFYRPLKGLEFATNLDVTGPMDIPHYSGDSLPVDGSGDPVPRLVRSPWFFKWDLSASYRWEFRKDAYVGLGVGVRNILNAYQSDLDRGPNRDAGYVYGPREPRTVYVAVKAGF
jgi:outer membrane receptor for ferrienterochelin and colicins